MNIYLAEITVNTYKTIAMVGYVLAVLFLIASVAIFFLYDIPKVFAYLSGRNKQKGITAIREKQEDNENAPPVAPSIKFGSDSSTPKTTMPPSVPITPNAVNPSAGGAQTTALGEQANAAASSAEDNDATGVLSPVDMTGDETLAEADTSVLSANTNIGSFVIIKDVMLIHTDQVL